MRKEMLIVGIGIVGIAAWYYFVHQKETKISSKNSGVLEEDVLKIFKSSPVNNDTTAIDLINNMPVFNIMPTAPLPVATYINDPQASPIQYTSSGRNYDPNTNYSYGTILSLNDNVHPTGVIDHYNGEYIIFQGKISIGGSPADFSISRFSSGILGIV